MHKILACLSILLCMTCSLVDDNGLALVRDLFPLETKIIGTWAWSSYADKDTVRFRDDLTYESVRQGMTYSGTFELNSDSLLTLTRLVMLHGTEFQEVMFYNLEWLEENQFRISSYNTPMVYYRVR